MRINSISSYDNMSNVMRSRTQHSAPCAPLKDAITNKKAAQLVSGYYGIIPNKHVAFGSIQSFVTKGADDIVLKITDVARKAAAVQLEVATKSQNSPDEVLKIADSARREADGFFHIKMPVINRQDNSYLDSVRTGKAMFFDLNGDTMKITETGQQISPLAEFSKIAQKKLAINGAERFSEFEIISGANTFGRYRVFDDYNAVKNYKGAEPICVMLDSEKAFSELLMDTMSEDFALPSTVKSIIVKRPASLKKNGGGFFLSCLSHAKCRMEGKQALIMAGDDVFSSIKSAYKDGGSIIDLNAKMETLSLSARETMPEFNNKVTLDPIVMKKGLLTGEEKGFIPEAVGIKAYNLAELKKISEKGGFEVPKFFVIQAGEFDLIKKKNPLLYHHNALDPNKDGLYHRVITNLDNAYDNSEPLDTSLEAIQGVIKKNMNYPKDFLTRLRSKVREVFGELPERAPAYEPEKPVMFNDIVLSVRSSFPNFEDLDKVSTQGMFSSVGGVRSYAELLPAIKKVWASKWGEIAYKGRREHAIPHDAVQPSVLVQDFVKDIDYIFTGYTRKIDDPRKVLIDLSQGVTSNMQGNPYLFEVNRETGEIQRTLLATKARKKDIQHVDINDKSGKKYIRTDYSNDPLNMNQENYAPIIKKISDALLFVEKHFGGKPQDIEGGIKFVRDAQGNVQDVKITLWQTRNVQMPQ